MKNVLLFLLVTIACMSCHKSDIAPPDGEMYFPTTTESEWESIDINSLDWNADALENLYTYLEINGTRSFIVLKDWWFYWPLFV